ARDKHLRTGKYADTAVQLLKDILREHGSNPKNLKAKIAGGSQMFQFQTDNEMMRIGKRNVEAVKERLHQLGIELVSEDVGGNVGRTIEFNPETFVLTVRKVNGGIIEI